MDPEYCNWDSSISNHLPLPNPPQAPELLEITQEWTWDENKKFEETLAEIDLSSPDSFQQIAMRLPQKTIEQVKKHFQDLLEDIELIESDHLPFPEDYGNGSKAKGTVSTATGTRKKRKAIYWTKEEHELFLTGLATYGKGDWRSIARYTVKSRTAAQVASHAQKYFLRIRKRAANFATESSREESTSSQALQSVPNDESSAAALSPHPSAGTEYNLPDLSYNEIFSGLSPPFNPNLY